MSVQSDINRILDVFGGTDGGVDFAVFKFAMEDLEKKALDGDYASEQLVLMMTRFRMLIDVMTKRGS